MLKDVLMYSDKGQALSVERVRQKCLTPFYSSSEMLADGTTRVVSELSVSSKIKALRARYVATSAKVPKQPDNDKATVFLKVPFAEKDEAKKLGAKWDATMKQWYVPVGEDVNLFAKWWPEMLKDVLM